MDFGDLAGNAVAKRQTAAYIDAGRFPHALLIEGEPGSGRRTMASRIARAAICRETDPARRPCGVCAACRKAEHPDILTVVPEKTQIPVERIRDLRRDAFVRPNESERRVLLFPDAGTTLPPPGQNALLKILEEPPAHLLFILTCENRTQLLETIRSRCVCVTMEPVSWEEAEPLLKKRLPRADTDTLRRAHGMYGGRIGRILDGVSDGTAEQTARLTAEFADAIIAPTESVLLRLTARLEKDRDLTAGVLNGLREIFRDALMISYGGTAAFAAPDQAGRLAARITAPRLLRLIEQTDRLAADLAASMNNTLLLTRMCAVLRQAAGY